MSSTDPAPTRQRPHEEPQKEKTALRRPWTPPSLVELPRLAHLTLQSGTVIGGTGGPGGLLFP